MVIDESRLKMKSSNQRAIWVFVFVNEINESKINVKRIQNKIYLTSTYFLQIRHSNRIKLVINTANVGFRPKMWKTDMISIGQTQKGLSYS